MQAFRLFFLAANQGSIDSLHNIATMYEHGCADAEGLVVRRDEEIAVRFWKEAAEKVRDLISFLLRKPGMINNKNRDTQSRNSSLRLPSFNHLSNLLT